MTIDVFMILLICYLFSGGISYLLLPKTKEGKTFWVVSMLVIILIQVIQYNVGFTEFAGSEMTSREVRDAMYDNIVAPWKMVIAMVCSVFFLLAISIVWKILSEDYET
jgi:hypothetical protein